MPADSSAALIWGLAPCTNTSFTPRLCSSVMSCTMLVKFSCAMASPGSSTTNTFLVWALM